MVLRSERSISFASVTQAGRLYAPLRASFFGVVAFSVRVRQCRFFRISQLLMPARAAVAVLVEGRAIQRINNIDEATQTDTNGHKRETLLSKTSRAAGELRPGS
jgi:hypothetical protein